MIKFFRKIRQKLLSENKLSKYLIYAIGEIILVVIGILIALQINNWNEEAKKKQELNLNLTNLQEEIEHNLYYIERGLKRFESDISNIEHYIALLNNEDSGTVKDSSIHMMINNLGRKRLQNLESNSYNNLVTSGIVNSIEMGKNDSLKKNILGMQNGFNTFYEIKTKWNSNLDNDLRPYLYKYVNFIDIDAFKGVAVNIPNKSYNALNLARFINNREFTNLLLIRHANNEDAIAKLNYMSSRFKMIHDDIEHYLTSD